MKPDPCVTRSRQSPSECISWAESRDLPHLQACMQEALRMHPAVGLPLERLVSKRGTVVI